MCAQPDLKVYRVSMAPFQVEAEDGADAEQQAHSMIEEGAWELTIEEVPTNARTT